jgi:hypothetical protein
MHKEQNDIPIAIGRSVATSAGKYVKEDLKKISLSFLRSQPAI